VRASYQDFWANEFQKRNASASVVSGSEGQAALLLELGGVEGVECWITGLAFARPLASILAKMRINGMQSWDWG
jgi:hypothetical protein